MPIARRALGVILALAFSAPAIADAAAGPFDQFGLPDAWEAHFWAEPGVKALRAMDPKAVAAMVPVQAGLRHCRCPACGAPEADDPLTWTAEAPEKLACRRCQATFPDDKFPAKVEGKVPEEVVEVLPRVFHHYPYHVVEAEKRLYPDERIYLAAKRDDRAREFLAKAALYAAARHRDHPDPALSRMACVLLLRFAQVYPAYATHFDQPGHAKHLDRADLAPPYRRSYGTAKWDWSGSLGVPLNLVVAYALVRDDPALAEAGLLLGDPRPSTTIERDLFRASAAFVENQPEELQEQTLFALRGLLAVGRLLNDGSLIRQAESRLGSFTRRGFTHDGLWCRADLAGHRRVVGQLDGWIGRLLPGNPDALPMLALARSAGGAAVSAPLDPEILQASWPPPIPHAALPRRAILLGGAGLARLAVGKGADALDLELRGFGDQGGPHSGRLAMRLAVGGRPVLGDLEDLPASSGGFERSTASHNAVVVDGLNQREAPALARLPAPGADCLFFAADPDFQVATMEDPRAYPRSTSRYRQTLLAVAGPKARYGVGVFEVRGGLQHEQLFQAAPGSPARWRPSVPMTAGPRTLLPPSITQVAGALAEDGRWFVQSFGEFGQLSWGRFDQPATATLQTHGAPGVRVHVLNDAPLLAFTGTSPEPAPASTSDDAGRAALILRRRSEHGEALATAFVTVFEPLGAAPPLRKVERVATAPGVVVLAIETADGLEHLIVNASPGTRRDVRLADGRTLSTDGLAVWVWGGGLSLAGGTVVELGGLKARQVLATGTIRDAIRRPSAEGQGYFDTQAPLPEPASLAGRVLLIRHGDGPVRGWTLTRVENLPKGSARLFVREEPGFRLDPVEDLAEYYQFPRVQFAGPHTFRIAKITRVVPAASSRESFSKISMRDP